MSMTFNAVCCIRIFSQSSERFLNKNKWSKHKIRDGSGYNYTSRYVFFDIDSSNELVTKMYDDYIYELNLSISDGNKGDAGEIYVFLDSNFDVTHFHGFEINQGSILKLCEMKLEFCFSLDTYFPDYQSHKFKDQLSVPSRRN